MIQLLKCDPNKPYVDLTVSFAVDGKDDEDLPVPPPVRYYIN